jgi:enoyl-CoA hydratase/carnithine racemase
VEELLARVAALPMVTVAAIQGHAFAAGAMLTLACDFRVMRADRGFWCLPEADIGLAFSAGMTALIQSRLAAPHAAKAGPVLGTIKARMHADVIAALRRAGEDGGSLRAP